MEIKTKRQTDEESGRRRPGRGGVGGGRGEGQRGRSGILQFSYE